MSSNEKLTCILMTVKYMITYSLPDSLPAEPRGKPSLSLGFPDSSVGKESACNAGDPGSIPGSERSTGEGTGYPFRYSWASLVVQLVKSLPALQETWV